MIINIIGDCDKRPVLYTFMKICQSLGDVLLITSSSRLMRLSDTGESMGHYQNTMIAVTQDGLDDFFDEFRYDTSDFEFTIIDNIVAAEADLFVYVKGMTQSENEVNNLEYLDTYETIELYKGGILDSKVIYNCEEFEALRDMCPISPKIASVVSSVFAKAIHKDAKNIEKIALSSTKGRR